MTSEFTPRGPDNAYANVRLTLDELVRRGLVTELVDRDGQERYAVVPTDESGTPTDRLSAPIVYDERLESCPHCGARAGFDGGARCNVCYVAWPPEM
jgi:hypothetical protein